jgi:SUMO ligase MMS21 Smc5/6 complex component
LLEEDEHSYLSKLTEALQELSNKELLISGQKTILLDTKNKLLNKEIHLKDLDKYYQDKLKSLKENVKKSGTSEYVKELKLKSAQLRGKDDDQDEDLQVVSQRVSYICPITTKLLVNPVKSSQCGHVYSKAAIVQMMVAHGRGDIECPKAGCNHYVRESYLKEDRSIARAVAKEERRLQLEAAKEKESYMSI